MRLCPDLFVQLYNTCTDGVSPTSDFFVRLPDVWTPGLCCWVVWSVTETVLVGRATETASEGIICRQGLEFVRPQFHI